MSNILIKPAEQRKKLKKKVEELKEYLPHNWKLLFIHDNKQYSEQSAFLHNVINGLSLHEPTILLIEKWATENKFNK